MDVGLRELVKIYMRRMIGNLMDDSVQGTSRTQVGRTTRPVSPSHGVDSGGSAVCIIIVSTHSMRRIVFEVEEQVSLLPRSRTSPS